MPSAKVLIAEIDRSSYVPESNGVYGYMSIPLVRGDTEKAGFATSEEQFLKQTTPEGRIEPGYDLGYYVALDFLRRSNKLYWGRAHNGALNAGLTIPAEGTSGLPVALPSGLDDPLSYIFGENDLFLIYATSRGKWGKDIMVTITKNTREPGAFNVNVYWKGVLKEEWPCSRSPSAKDGNQQSLYIETVLEASEYVRAVDNTLIPSDVGPKYLGVLTTKWNAVATTTPYSAASDAVAEQNTYSFEGANVLAGRFPASVAGAAFVIPVGATSTGVATAAAGGDYSETGNVSGATSSSNVLAVDFNISAGDVDNQHRFLPHFGVTTPAEPAVPGQSAVVAAAAKATVTFAGPAYGAGSVNTNVGGRSYVVAVTAVDTKEAIAARLQSAIAGDTSALVNSSLSGAVLTLTAQTPGSAGNSLNNSNTNNVPGFSATHVAFAGGANAAPASATIDITGTATAAGPVSFQIGSQSYPITIAVGNTGAAIAQSLTDAINADAAGSVIATLTGTEVVLTAKQPGLTGNNTAVANTAPVAGVTVVLSGSTLVGGANAIAATATITVNPADIQTSVWTALVGGKSYAVAGGTGDTAAALATKLVNSVTADSSAEITAAASGAVVTLTNKLTGTSGNALAFSSSGSISGATVTRSQAFTGGLNPSPAIPASPYVPAVTKDLVIVRDFLVATAYDATNGIPKAVTFNVGSNRTGSQQILLVEDYPVVIAASDTTGALVAARILAAFPQIQLKNSNFQSCSVTGDVVKITYTAAAADYRFPIVVNSAALPLNSSYVAQSYQASIPGVNQVEELNVTGAPTAAGNVSVNGIQVAITGTDSRSLVASKIAAAVNADVGYSATSVGEKVVITYLATGPQTALSYSAGGTGVGFANLTTTTGVAAIPAIPKKFRLKLGGGNPYGVDVSVNIEGVVVNVGPAASNSTQVAAAIAAANWAAAGDVVRVVATGAEVEFEFSTASGDRAAPRIWAGFSSLLEAHPVVSREFAAAKAATAEVQQLRITAGNSSGASEILYIGGVAVNIGKSDTSEASVVLRLAVSDLPGSLPSIASVAVLESDPRVLEIRYKVAAGDVDPLTVASAGASPVRLGGGSDGAQVTDTHMIKSLDLQRPLDYNVMMDAGWTSAGFQKEMASVSSTRMTSLSILSVPYAAENNSNYMDAIVNYRMNVLNLDSSYAALFTGHLQITDKFNDRKLWIPPSGAVGALASNTITNLEPWYPFAGDTRGQLDWPTDVRRHFSEGEMDRLQDNQINPILFEPGRGIKLWGQRTLQSRPSALDRINVRLLMIYIEVAMKEFLRAFHWELNDDDTRALLVGGADEFMESIKTRKGIYAYKNICDDTNNSPQDVDNNRLNFHQLLEPVKAIEEIRYYPTLMRTGSIQ